MRLSAVGVSVVLLAMSAAPLKAQERGAKWVGTWAAAPMDNAVNPGQPSPGNSTYRNIVRISAGGPAVRVVLTNEFGGQPLTVGAAHIALSAGAGSIQAGSDHVLTFSGRESLTIPVGALAVSDPVAMPVAALSGLALSVYLPEQRIGTTTCHDDGQSTNYVAAGDQTAATALNAARTIGAWCFVKGVDVSASSGEAAAIVTLGDSITDGALSTVDANRRWPDVLAERLQADKKTAHLSVLNEGISGNRLLHERAGPSALNRFDRDVIAQSGVKYLIILEGINDLGSIARPRDPADVVTIQDVEFAFTQMITRAHQHGIKVFAATIAPYKGAGYFSDAGEKIRQDVNQWMRTGGVFDGVVDFDQATRDPANPAAFLPEVDSGDHLHPGDAGYKVMGSAIDLSIFN